MKKTLFTTLVLAITMNLFAQIPTNGLVGYWSFTGNANDQSGNNNNGTVSGATLVADRFGNSNAAYSFNGVNNQINVPSASSISTFTNGQSLSFWVKISAYPSDNKEHYIIDKKDNCGMPNTMYYQALISNYTSVNDVLYRYAQSASVSSQGTNFPFTNVPLNQWVHISFATDLTTTKAYINGVRYLTFVQNSPIGVTTNPLIFGNTNCVGATNAPYSGSLDDIRIYNRALDSTEVLALYNEGVCYQNITVTDTLKINHGLTGFNPVTFENTIKIYPNPTADHITINYGNYSTMAGYTLTITNMLGQIMFTTPINQQTSYVALSTLGGNGVYFVNTINAQGQTVDIKKIVLQ